MNEPDNQIFFSQDQIDYLSSMHFINRIDTSLKTVSSVDIINQAENLPPRVLLALEIYYHDKRVDTLSFNLHNYTYEDIVDIAQNIRGNEYLLQEIDNFLAGDVLE